MRAIVQDRYGSSDVLELRDIATPAPGAGEVLVAVRAAGLDQGVWHLMEGVPYPVRLAGYGLRAPKNPVPGSDLAGVVEAVGPGRARAFGPATRCSGSAWASFAEFAAAREDRLAPRPARLTFVQAAAVAVSGRPRSRRCATTPGCGPARVCWSSARPGASAPTPCSSRRRSARRSPACARRRRWIWSGVGADRVIDYTREDFADGDPALRRHPGHRWQRLAVAPSPRPRPAGTLVIVGGETGGRWLGGTDRQVRARLWSPFVRQRLTTFIARENREDMVVLADLIATGAVTPAIDRTYPLDGCPTPSATSEAGTPRQGRHHAVTPQSGGGRIPASSRSSEPGRRIQRYQRR